jgi:hypothetical protein
MKQYINFYQPEFHRKSNLHRYVLRGGIGLAVVLLISINLYQQAVINRLSHELTQQQDQLNSRKLLHQALGSRVQPKQPSPVLLSQLESLRQDNQSRLNAINFLGRRENDNMTGFSFLLKSLGRQRDNIEGIWLKKIHFDDGGFNLRLEGYSHSAELLPQLVQTLSKEEILRGHEFRHVNITRSTERKQIMDFELDTRQDQQQNETGAAPAEIALFMTKLKQLATVEKTQN